MTTDTAQTSPTSAERFAWVAFGVAAGVALVAAVILMVQIEDRYEGEPATPAAILAAALPLMGLTFVPALILTGIRQMFTPRAAADETPADHSSSGVGESGAEGDGA